ncbi:hypothetical protein ILP92_03505 [Maribius pontilimi]|uniref:Uncharacterized protein n=1 Tax=Palleronia pontilimi TaxID=1964209 RepID=A0A934I7D0_9RHOB|nr:hypothetical protein [Palleronia pontilimi]MBJ3761814.1 hypothetical protein [Palleronia pontilimi]
MSHLQIHGPPGQPLTELRASPTRRFIGVFMIGALGVLLLWIAVSQPASPLWRVVLGAGGIGVLWCGFELWRATGGAVVLKPEGLFTETDAPLAPLDQIETIERGAFAFKPSNGFSVKLKTRVPFGWAPGMWWRLGRRVGVGGVTSPGEAKAIAELLQVLMAERTE